MGKKETMKQGRLPAPDFDKLYYSIGEVASILDVNPSLIRYWEEQFNIIHPKRNKKGNRTYTRQDLERLELIQFLLKTKGFTLKGAREALREDMDRYLKEREVVRRLKNIRAQLLDLKQDLGMNTAESDQK